MKSILTSLLAGAALLAQTGHGLYVAPADPALESRADTLGLPRSATLVFDLHPDMTEYSAVSQASVMSTHAFLELGERGDEPAIRIELVMENATDCQVLPAIRVLDRSGVHVNVNGTAANGSGHAVGVLGRAGSIRRIFQLTQTTVGNVDIMNPSSGAGIVLEAWNKDAIYKLGGNGAYNAGLTFIVRLLQDDRLFGPGYKLPAEAQKYVDLGIEYGSIHGPHVEVSLNRLFYDRLASRAVKASDSTASNGTAADGVPANTRVAFFIQNGNTPLLLSRGRLPASPTVFVDLAPQQLSPGAIDGPAAQAFGLAALNANGTVDGEPVLAPVAVGIPDNEGKSTFPVDHSKTNLIGIIAGEATTTVVVAIAAGAVIVSPIILASAAIIAPVVAAAGIATALVFIILELSQGHFLAAGFALAGLGAGAAVGVAVGFATIGPVGWIVGGALALLGAILPGVFGKKKHKPDGDHVNEIIQWVMFGDAKHTGTEKCKEAHKEADCVALFGPGVLANVFKWNVFDAAIFLIGANKGYPMSIPDMAKAFHVTHPFQNDTGAAHALTIDCQWRKASDKRCSNPVFRIKRERIPLPNLNATANQIFDRIIPAPNGDCKIVTANGNGQYFDNYNVTVQGTPVSIACGVDVGLFATNTTNPASLSTGDDGGDAFIPAPPATPFKKLSPADNVACVGSTADKTYQCFPAGKFGKMDGSFGGWDLRHADSLLLPTGSKFKWGKHHDITTDQTTADERFRKDVSRYNPKKDTMEFRSANDNDASSPVACLYDQPQYKGNVVCFGAGGGDLPKAAQAKARSLSIHGDALVWAYPESYGDLAGVYITTDTPDLGVFPFGNSGNFSMKAKALWIHD